MEWGGNAIFTLDGGQLHFKSYYKMPAPQADNEICTAHNGNLIPVPGRDIMVQAFYRAAPRCSIGPIRRTRSRSRSSIAARAAATGRRTGTTASSSSSDEQRGMDIHELTPSPYLSQNEIDAAKSVHFDQYNAQEQTHIVWPATFALARAYLDQLERNGGLSASRIAAVRNELTSAEGASGGAAQRRCSPTTASAISG